MAARPVAFRIDTDANGELDDLAISSPSLVRLERMSRGTFWGRITMDDGRAVELAFWIERGKLCAKAEVV